MQTSTNSSCGKSASTLAPRHSRAAPPALAILFRACGPGHAVLRLVNRRPGSDAAGKAGEDFIAELDIKSEH